MATVPGNSEKISKASVQTVATALMSVGVAMITQSQGESWNLQLLLIGTLLAVLGAALFIVREYFLKGFDQKAEDTQIKALEGDMTAEEKAQVDALVALKKQHEQEETSKTRALVEKIVSRRKIDVDREERK